MADLATTGYTVDDLDWLRDEIGVAHIELDPWGSLIVSPATDEHEVVAAVLLRQAVEQLTHTVSSNGFGWIVPGGTGYLMVPDLTVLDAGWQRVDELHFDPPPLLVVEIASRSTRRVDRTRKLADYRLGGAEKYLLVDLPSTEPAGGSPPTELAGGSPPTELAGGSPPTELAGGSPPTFELHDFTVGTVVKATGSIDLVVGGQPLRFSLP